jgi:hypothetical protein
VGPGYAAFVYLLLNAGSLVAVGVCLAFGWLRAAAGVGVLTALAYGSLLGDLAGPTNSGFWGCQAVWPPVAGVHLAHVLADCAERRAAWAAAWLPWAAVPALATWGVVARAALMRAGTQERWRWTLAPALLASLPSLALVAAMLSARHGWAVDDPRWSARYLEEWIEAGTPPRGAGVCYRFLEEYLAGRLDGRVEPATLARGRALCAAACGAQAREGSFNPGVFEHTCARLRE